MYKHFYFFTKLFLLVTSLAIAQTGLTEDFNDNVTTGWTGSTYYALSETNNEQTVTVTAAGGITSPNSYQIYTYTFSQIDVSNAPYMTLRIKNSEGLRLRVDMEDANGRATNATPTYIDASSSTTYKEYSFNFAGRFSQSFPSTATVSPTTIRRLVFFVNPGMGTQFTGSFNIDDIKIGSNANFKPTDLAIRLNQVGYYPQAPKLAIAVSANAGNFYIVKENKLDTVFTGVLGAATGWSFSGETVRKADFTAFKTIGKYYLTIPEIGYSYLFEIKPDVHHQVAKASIKSFYYQRASSAIVQPWAGKWPRALGHADKVVEVHNSAATTKRPTGFKFNSSKGWYDAGDYNKYVINSGISTYTMLALYEHFSQYYDTVNTFIPESKNDLPDLLDECLWQVRWLLTTQDPSDNGVYFKITDADFTGIDMPNADNQTRYAVKKTTSSALNFAAVMAQAARVAYKNKNQLPGLSDTLITKAIAAWVWARKNPNIQYIQSQLSNPAINTGEYGDGTFSDEFQWAAHELYVTTKLDSFYTIGGLPSSISVPGWNNTRALGIYTLNNYLKSLTSIADTTTIKNRLLTMANSLRAQYNSSAYGVAMGQSNGDFSWGSNGHASNQGMLLLQAFRITKDSTYLFAALANLDYVLGRNATDYCFITGQGSKSPGFLHHRISAADPVFEPIPGLLAGGPTRNAVSDCGAESYPSTFVAKTYFDDWCSYSTNEVAINWNAPFSYLAGALEAVESGYKIEAFSFDPILPGVVGVEDELLAENVSIYPNPFSDKLTILSKDNTLKKIEIRTIDGQVVYSVPASIGENIISKILPNGMYFVSLYGQEAVRVEKLIKINQ